MTIEVRLEGRASHSIRSCLLVREDDDLYILRLEFKRGMPILDRIRAVVSAGHSAIDATPFDLVVLLKVLALVFRHRFDIGQKQLQRGVASRRRHKMSDVRVHYPGIVVLQVEDRVRALLHHGGAAEADSEAAESGNVVAHKRQAELCEAENTTGHYAGFRVKGPMDNLGGIGLFCKPEAIAVEIG